MCDSLKDKTGSVYRMSGIFDAEAEMTNKRHGPTYVSAVPTDINPFFNSRIRAHEYHYSTVRLKDDSDLGYDLERGAGITGDKDGIVTGSSMGTFMHQHALSCPDWASGIISACR